MAKYTEFSGSSDKCQTENIKKAQFIKLRNYEIVFVSKSFLF